MYGQPQMGYGGPGGPQGPYGQQPNMYGDKGYEERSCMSTKLKWILALVLIFIGCILASAAAGNPYWIKANTDDGSSLNIHMGLWYSCVALGLVTACGSTIDSGNVDWYIGVQATAGLSEICYFIAMIMLLVYACCKRTNCVKLTMIGFMVVGIVCQTVTVAIYGWKTNEDDYIPFGDAGFKYDWCFYIYIVSIVMITVGTGFLYQIPAQDRDDRMMGVPMMAPGMMPGAGPPPMMMQQPQQMMPQQRMPAQQYPQAYPQKPAYPSPASYGSPASYSNRGYQAYPNQMSYGRNY